MQVFAVDEDPRVAARSLCDKHVNSQCKESGQILSASFYLRGKWESWMTKPAWLSHPVVLWTALSEANQAWVLAHGILLGVEYWLRFGRKRPSPKTHASLNRLERMTGLVSPTLWSGHLPFVQAFDESLRRDDPVDGYRLYYRTKSFAVWKNGRPPPEWW